MLQLATLEVARITVEAMSVMSQVVIDLPVNDFNLPAYSSYAAISSLDYPIFFKNSLSRKSRDKEDSTEVSEIEFEGWEIIDYEVF